MPTGLVLTIRRHRQNPPPYGGNRLSALVTRWANSAIGHFRPIDSILHGVAEVVSFFQCSPVPSSRTNRVSTSSSRDRVSLRCIFICSACCGAFHRSHNTQNLLIISLCLIFPGSQPLLHIPRSYSPHSRHPFRPETEAEDLTTCLMMLLKPLFPALRQFVWLLSIARAFLSGFFNTPSVFSCSHLIFSLSDSLIDFFTHSRHFCDVAGMSQCTVWRYLPFYRIWFFFFHFCSKISAHLISGVIFIIFHAAMSVVTHIVGTFINTLGHCIIIFHAAKKLHIGTFLQRIT